MQIINLIFIQWYLAKWHHRFNKEKIDHTQFVFVKVTAYTGLLNFMLFFYYFGRFYDIIV